MVGSVLQGEAHSVYPPTACQGRLSTEGFPPVRSRFDPCGNSALERTSISRERVGSANAQACPSAVRSPGGSLSRRDAAGRGQTRASASVLPGTEVATSGAWRWPGQSANGRCEPLRPNPRKECLTFHTLRAGGPASRWQDCRVVTRVPVFHSWGDRGCR